MRIKKSAINNTKKKTEAYFCSMLHARKAYSVIIDFIEIELDCRKSQDIVCVVPFTQKQIETDKMDTKLFFNHILFPLIQVYDYYPVTVYIEVRQTTVVFFVMKL